MASFFNTDLIDKVHGSDVLANASAKLGNFDVFFARGLFHVGAVLPGHNVCQHLVFRIRKRLEAQSHPHGDRAIAARATAGPEEDIYTRSRLQEEWRSHVAIGVSLVVAVEEIVGVQ